MSKAVEAETVVLEYGLHDLPTAQHKAGLAGLILMIDSMNKRKLPSVPGVEYDADGAKVLLTRDSMQALFDDLYDASWVEFSSKTRWKGKPPKRTEESKVKRKDGENGTEKRFVYDVVQARGEFLPTLYSGNSVWVRLWRDVLWTTLRGIPKTRGVYQERAEGRPSSLAGKMLDRLRRTQVAKHKGETYKEGIASCLYVGAQDVNAEKVPFLGQVQLNLLLHFWPIASLTYVPRQVSADGRMEDIGYVLAVPEPATLATFVKDVEALLGALPDEVSGFRPKAALIDLPEEGGLEYLYQLTHSRIRQTDTDIAHCLTAIEVYHIDRHGNSIRTLAAERILPDASVLEDYDALRRECRNPLFKAQRIRNLLAGNAWYHGMIAVFATHPWPFFIQGAGTPSIPFFGSDVGRKLKLRALEGQAQFRKGGVLVNDETGDDYLALCVHRLIREYANRRTDEKSGLRFEEFKSRKDEKGRIRYPPKYREAKESICRDAFLAMRGRRAQAFIEYFTGTVCSVPQYLPEDDYVVVSQALLADWEKVKTLAMLALSAASRVGGSTEDNMEGEYR